MPKYTYTAINIQGKEIKGEHTAPDDTGVANMLQQQGYYATKIKRGSNLSDISFGTPKLPIKVVARLCSQISAMLRSGVPIVRTLEMLAMEADNKQLKKILEDVNISISQGSTLSHALKPHEEAFPVLFHSMVDAGEASGTLDSCLERASTSFTRTAKLNARAKNAMIYPAIILVVLIALLVVMLIVVVPAFAEIFEEGGADLPAFTQGLMAASEFLQNNFIIVIAVVLSLAIIVVTFFRTEFGRYRLHRFLTRVPKLSILINKLYAARFTRSLSSLVTAGVNMPTALDISSRTVVNTYLVKALEQVVVDVKQGMQLSDSMQQMGKLPPLVASVIKIGEESGELEDMLSQIADYYDDEADSAIQAMLSMLEPALILIMAAIVVPVLFGVLQPMFQMMDVVADM